MCFYFSNRYKQQIEGWHFRKYIQEFLFRTLIFRKLCIYTLAVYILRRYNLLQVQSCKLYNNNCMIAKTQITNTEIFAFIAVHVFKILSRTVLFINRKDNKNC